MRGAIQTARLWSQTDLEAKVNGIVHDGCPHGHCKQPARLIDWGVAVEKAVGGSTLLIVDLTCTRGHETFGYERL